MIFNLLFKTVSIFLQMIFNLLPSLPQFPKIIMDSFYSFLSFIDSGLSFVKWLIDPTLFNALLSLFILYLSFDYIYKFTMFIIRKLPIGVK